MPQNRHLYLAFDAHTLEKIYENTSNLNSTACPTFDWAHLDGLALGPVFRVPPAEGRHKMTNKPPQGLRAATTSSASSYDPTRSYRSRTSFATRLFAAATRTIRALYKIATASRLYSLPEQV